MPITKNTVDVTMFNQQVQLPYALRVQDFQMAMQDIYDFLYDVNAHLTDRGLQRLDDMLRPANMSGVLPDMLTASLAKHSRILRKNSTTMDTRTSSSKESMPAMLSRPERRVWR